MATRQLRFSFNWNNKLLCKSWTTLRLQNPKKYQVGFVYEVYLKGEFIGNAELIGVRKTKSANINQFVSFLDTGYSVAKTQEIIKRMYKKENPDLYFMLFRWVKIATGSSIDLKVKK